jgi:N-acetylmuramoyl-L-alanine amidase
MTRTKKAVGSAGLIATIMGIAFFVFTPEQVDLKSQEVQALIIHCSATREGQKNITPKVVDGWHTLPKPRGRGERVNPYNVIIGLENTVWFRPWNQDKWLNRTEVSWGSAEYNICSFNICYTGGMNKQFTKAKNTLTQYQDSMLWVIVCDFKKQFPFGFVIGHNQINKKKACPSFSVPKWIKYHSKEHKQYNNLEFNL